MYVDIVLTHSAASGRSTAQRTATKASPRDASLDLFKELYKYKGRIVLYGIDASTALAAEATFLCQILFLEFLTLRAPAHLNITPVPNQHAPKTFYRDALQPRLQEWFPTFENDALEIDSHIACELLELFSHFAWHGQTNSIQPWLLGYVFERWIKQRESGSYFTPDLLAYNIAQLAMQEWLETQAELELGTAQDLRDARQKQKINSSSTIAWLRTKLNAARIVDLSMGGGAFLVAATRVLFALREKFLGDEFNPANAVRQIFTNNIYGMDISRHARRVAQMRLWLLTLELNAFDDSFKLHPLEHLTTGDALASAESRAEFVQLRLLREPRPTLLNDSVAQDFDICIGNPPFIALSQKSGVSNKERLVQQWNKRHPEYMVTPTIDLSNFFILRGVERLKPNGVLAYITSRNFFDTRYGAPIRRYLTEQVALQNIITLHDHPFTQLGVKVKANTVILSLVKRVPSQTIHFQHLSFWNEPLTNLKGAAIPRRILQKSNNWTNTLFDHPLRAELRARMTHNLGEYARVKMGIKSGCNSFFLLRTDSDANQQLAAIPDALVPAIKNSRDVRGFLLSTETPHRFLNLYAQVTGLEEGFDGKSFKHPLEAYLFHRGIQYPCAECQSCAKQQHKTHPERFPHRNMCEQCELCRQNGVCDRPVDRLSTQGHLPAWYTLALGEPPLIAVQCIVDTEIGVFLNRERVYVTDQFQVLDAPQNPELGMLLFMYLQSRVSHFLLEGSGLHRARYDGSFMLKIQVEHLRELGCPDFARINARQKKTLLQLLEKFSAATNRKSDTVQYLRDELDDIFLDLLEYSKEKRKEIQPALRAALEQAIRFRWVKTRARMAEMEKNGNGSGNGN